MFNDNKECPVSLELQTLNCAVDFKYAGKMLEKFQITSVNQLAAEIKLTEVWKSINVDNCPTRLDPYNQHANTSQLLRPKSNRVFNDSSKLRVSKSSFSIDAARVWNTAPNQIRNAPTLAEAKRLIKQYAKSLPT